MVLVLQVKASEAEQKDKIIRSELSGKRCSLKTKRQVHNMKNSTELYNISIKIRIKKIDYLIYVKYYGSALELS